MFCSDLHFIIWGNPVKGITRQTFNYKSGETTTRSGFKGGSNLLVHHQAWFQGGFKPPSPPPGRLVVNIDLLFISWEGRENAEIQKCRIRIIKSWKNQKKKLKIDIESRNRNMESRQIKKIQCLKSDIWESHNSWNVCISYILYVVIEFNMYYYMNKICKGFKNHDYLFLFFQMSRVYPQFLNFPFFYSYFRFFYFAFLDFCIFPFQFPSQIWTL